MTAEARRPAMSVSDDGAELGLRDVARAHPPIRYFYWLLCLLRAPILLKFGWSVASNKNFEWGVVAKWLTAESILRGLAVTLGLAAVSMLIGIVLGLLLAVARMSSN